EALAMPLDELLQDGPNGDRSFQRKLLRPRPHPPGQPSHVGEANDGTNRAPLAHAGILAGICLTGGKMPTRRVINRRKNAAGMRSANATTIIVSRALPAGIATRTMTAGTSVPAPN